MSKKPMVYVAGAYSKPDPVRNAHNYIRVGTELIEDGLVTPFIPHLSLLWQVVTPRPYGFWLDYDKEVLAKCGAVFRPFTDYSEGAEAEIMFAHELGIPVFYSLTTLYEWVGTLTRKQISGTSPLPVLIHD